MRTLLTASLLASLGIHGTEPSGATAQARQEDVVVVAEVRASSEPWSLCGVIAVVGEVHFEVIEVEAGSLKSREFVARINCPQGTYETGRVFRVRLGPSRQTARGPELLALDELPRFHLRSAETVASFKRFPLSPKFDP